MDLKDAAITRLQDELNELKSKVKTLEKRLKKQEPFSFLSAEVLPDPVVFYNASGHVLFLNSAFEQVFGWSLEELKNKKIDFVPQDKKEETKANLELIYTGNKIASFETTRFTKQGNLLTVQLSASVFDHPDGKGACVVYRDITQNRLVKELLVESEEKYRSVMEAAADPIIVYDDQGRVTYFNKAFSRVFKWSLTERIYKKMDDFVPKENWPETKKMIKLVMDGKYFSGIETARFDKDGNIIPVSISGSTYKDKDNNVIGSIINLQDIRKRKQMEKSIKQQEKLQGVLEMAGAVCHELSQPAMIIEGYADLFLLNLEKDDPMTDKMIKLKSQVKRIGDLTQKLMKVTKYETREYSKGKTIVDIDRASSDGSLK